MSSSFRPDRLAAIAAAEDVHPWFVARRRMVAGLVRRHRPDRGGTVVDVGCGTGRMLREVVRPTDEPVGIDLLAGQSHRGHVGPARAAERLVVADARDLPVDSDGAMVVLALDVLEHVEEDHRVAAEIARVAAPGALVVVTVPAHPWLWSHRDDDAGHVRRYTRAGLRAVLTGGGLQVRQESWFAGATLPAVAALRLLGRRWPGARDLEERPEHGLAGRALHRVLAAEADAVVAGGGPPLGSSLVVVATWS